MRSRFLNGGAYSRAAFVAIAKTATAAGSGDATEVDGAWVDRILNQNAGGGMPLSAKLIITYEAALGQDETLKFGVQFRDATDIDGSGAADYGDAVAATVVATGNSGGSTEQGVAEVDIDLAGARQFIQAQVTPDLSAGGTDTLKWTATLEFYGHNRQPISPAIGSVGGL